MQPFTLSRRQFLRRMGIATGTALSASWIARLRAADASPKKLRIVILGAGLAGLCAAYELEKKGHSVTLLEAEPKHIGGRARTLRFASGLYGEAGAMRIPTKHQITRAYIKEFNLPLRPFIMGNPNAYLYVRDKRVRTQDALQLNPLFALAPAEKNKSSDDLWAQVVTAKLKSLTDAERADLLSPAPTTAAIRALDDLSLEGLFYKSGLSNEAIELMEVTQAEEMEMQYACTESLREELKEVWSHDFDEIVGGTDTLPAAFAKNIKGEIRQGCEVIALTQDLLQKTATALYRPHAGSDETLSLQGDFILCTLPVPVMQRLDLSPTFSFAKRKAIRQMQYDSSTKVLLTAKRRFWETDDQIYGGGSFTDLPSGMTYYPADNALKKDPAVSAKPAVMLASYTWGMGARRLGALPPDKRAALVIHHLAKLHPQLAEKEMVQDTASFAWDTHPWSGGAFAWFNPGQQTRLYADLIAPEGPHPLCRRTRLAHSHLDAGGIRIRSPRRRRNHHCPLIPRNPKMQKLLIATGNAGKVIEIQHELHRARLDFQLLSLKDFPPIPECVEDRPTFIGNACKKARHYAAAANCLTLADDSGLCVDALSGQPGVLSARYSNTTGTRHEIDSGNNQKLLLALENVEGANRSAAFVCALALSTPHAELAVMLDQVDGQILREPRGQNGFGYDPLFYFPQFKRTTAELTLEEKTHISHRGKALRRMLAWIRENQSALSAL